LTTAGQHWEQFRNGDFYGEIGYDNRRMGLKMTVTQLTTRIMIYPHSVHDGVDGLKRKLSNRGGKETEQISQKGQAPKEMVTFFPWANDHGMSHVHTERVRDFFLPFGWKPKREKIRT